MKLTPEQKEKLAEKFQLNWKKELTLKQLYERVVYFIETELSPVKLEVMSEIAEVNAGKITISIATSNVEEDYMNIEIRTGKSRVRCKMQMKEYGLAISGLAMQPIDVEIK